MAKLFDLKAKNIRPRARNIPDGTVTGLRLEAGKTKGYGKWMLRFVSPESGKRRDMGLGTYPDVTIADAREAAAMARVLIRDSKDPIATRKATMASRQADVDALNFEQGACIRW